jgi:hypothetical protein
LTSLPFLIHSDRPVLAPKIAQQIKRWYVSVRLDTDARFTEEQVRAAFTDKECVEVEVWQAMFASVDLGVLRLFEGVRGVKIAKVNGSVGTEYKRWLEGVMMSSEGKNIEGWKGESNRTTNYDIWDNGNR